MVRMEDMRRIKKGDIVRRGGKEGVVVALGRKSVLVRWEGCRPWTTYVNRTWFDGATLINSR